MLDIDKYAYISGLNKTSPMEKLLFSILTMITCIVGNRIILSIIVTCLMGAVTVLIGRIPLRFYVKLLLVPMSFLVLGTITIAFDYNNTSTNMLFYVRVLNNYLGLSSTGIVTAIGVFFKALGSVSCLYFLSLSTPMLQLTSALKKLKIPLIIIELMILIYRFIFVLLETAVTMCVAQSSRLGYRNLRTGFKSVSYLGATLFIRAYKRSNELYTSLEARCYNGELNVIEEIFHTSYRNIAGIAVINITLALLSIYI